MVAERVADRIADLVDPDDRAGIEGTHVECSQVEGAMHLRIRSQQHLEAAVETEPVDDVGADPTADPVRCFEYGDGLPGASYASCG